MNSKASNIVWMCFKGNYFLVCVIVEDSELEVIAPCNKPVLPGNKFRAANGNFCNLKRLYKRSSFMVVDMYRSVV